MINSGEKNEALLKLKLIDLRDSRQQILLNGTPTIVSSVGFNSEYGSLPVGTDLRFVYNQAYNGNLAPLDQLVNMTNARKAGAFDKADVFINHVGYSVKSLQEAPPAIVNHTPRFGWYRICNQLGININELDAMIDDYWNKRINGDIMEDISNNDPNSPFKNHLDYLRPLLNYFLFTGTGQKDSPNPASYILEFTDPLDPSTWFVHGYEYLNSHWNDLVFSVRHKGFNENIKNEAKRAINLKWARYFQGMYKGSLHVRFRG